MLPSLRLATTTSTTPSAIEISAVICATVMSPSSVGLRRQEFDDEPLEAGGDQVGRRARRLRRDAVAQVPEHEGHEPHPDGLVDRRRMTTCVVGTTPSGRPSPTAHPTGCRSRRRRRSGSRRARGRSPARAPARPRRHLPGREPAPRVHPQTAAVPPIAPPYQVRPEPPRRRPAGSSATPTDP